MLYNLQVWCFRHLFFSTNTTHIFKKHQELVSVYSFKKKRSHSLHQFQIQMRPWMFFCQKPGDVTFWLDSNLNEISSQRLGWKVRPPEKNTGGLGPRIHQKKKKNFPIGPQNHPWKMKVLISPPKYGLQPEKRKAVGSDGWYHDPTLLEENRIQIHGSKCSPFVGGKPTTPNFLDRTLHLYIGA